MFNNAYRGKKVFVTGHTGFKGGWLCVWLKMLGAKVCGYSLIPNYQPSLFEVLDLNVKIDQSVIGNILDERQLERTLTNFKPDIIFHLAAQPLVRFSYTYPKLTYETNIIGTLNVLEAARKCQSVRAFVNVTTDKCYENRETLDGYKEDAPMGGYDMYSSSKGCVEIMSSSYRRSFLSKEGAFLLATARAGNVIGGGDWSSDRLVPDCIRSIIRNEVIEIRNPDSIRPWQFILEPISGYLLLGQKLLEYGRICADGFNFGPNNEDLLKVIDVVNNLIEKWGKGNVVIKNDKDNFHEANFLILNIDKAKKILGWYPTLKIGEAIRETVSWYKNFYDKDADIYEFTMKQIIDFEKKIKWKHY